MTNTINSGYFNPCVAVLNFRLIPKSLSILHQKMKMNCLFVCLFCECYPVSSVVTVSISDRNISRYLFYRQKNETAKMWRKWIKNFINGTWQVPGRSTKNYFSYLLLICKCYCVTYYYRISYFMEFLYVNVTVLRTTTGSVILWSSYI